MVKMVPDYMDEENSRLGAERTVFRLLSGLDEAGVAMHSLWQKNQTRKFFGEVDFLLITKKGLLCFEVKGGIISREDGLWYSTSKNGIKNDIHNPFNQAKDCRYALNNYLKPMKKFKDVLVGMGVIFPDCIFTGQGNDIVTEVQYDYNYKGSFKDYVASTYKYWQDAYLEKAKVKTRNLSDDEIADLQRIFRADFQSVPAMNIELEQIDKQIIQLTEEQFDLLTDATEENDRVLIQGVAGTGKSIIATEKASRLIASGEKVAYVCFNKNMAQYAANRIGNIPEGSYVGTFSALIDKYYPIVDFEKSLAEICADFTKQNITPDKFDVLITDEAQDLMDLDIIDCMSLFLEKKMDGGRWIFLFDPNQNIFQPEKNFNETVEYLKKGCNGSSHILRTNCRNTKQIAQKVASITKTGAARIMNIQGQDVVIEPYEDSKDLISKLKYRIQSLITAGVDPRNIVILSKYKFENSDIKNVDSICNYKVIEMHGLPKDNIKCLKYYTVQSFKGLDAEIVFYIDIKGFSSVSDRMINYVGLSRAKSLLYSFYRKEALEDLSDFMMSE